MWNKWLQKKSSYRIPLFTLRVPWEPFAGLWTLELGKKRGCVVAAKLMDYSSIPITMPEMGIKKLLIVTEKTVC